MSRETSRGDREALPPVRQWRIHLGAHKTATTHLQQTLAAVRDDLTGQGVDFIPTPRVRARNLASALGRPRPIARLPIVGSAHMRDAIEAVLAPLRIGPEVVAFSEENILGVPGHMLAAPLYPRAAVNLGRLASLAGRAEVVFFLSIRSYDTLIPSAYVETLKHAPPPPGGFREACGAAAFRAAELVRPRLAHPRRRSGHPLADLARVEAGDLGDPRGHLRHPHRPVPAADVQYGRIVEFWSALSVGLLAARDRRPRVAPTRAAVGRSGDRARRLHRSRSGLPPAADPADACASSSPWRWSAPRSSSGRGCS